ncbi:MAG: hypothetical protein IJD43_08030 [Thermoguttaceae bacterium]|nr:hypothetical protein [Thermoguttaceae bacterium]
MKPRQDENLIIDYICGALDEPEERVVSQRLVHDGDFCQLYRQLLQALRPILSVRQDTAENQKFRKSSTGLADRTLAALRKRQTQKLERLPRNESVVETIISNLTETRLGVQKKEKEKENENVSESANAEIFGR